MAGRGVVLQSVPLLTGVAGGGVCATESVRGAAQALQEHFDLYMFCNSVLCVCMW